MQQTSGLAGGDDLPWEAVAKAAARLRKRGHLDWDYDRWPNESREPPPESIDYMNFQRTRNVTISGSGLQALSALEAKAASRQLNIVNSFVGQVALGDITNIDPVRDPRCRRKSPRSARCAAGGQGRSSRCPPTDEGGWHVGCERRGGRYSRCRRPQGPRSAVTHGASGATGDEACQGRSKVDPLAPVEK